VGLLDGLIRRQTHSPPKPNHALSNDLEAAEAVVNHDE
jgi:hypothetical protein